MKKAYFVHKSCNYCGSTGKNLIYKIGEQNLVRCNNCKITYFDKQRIDFDNLYNDAYFSKSESNTANYFNYEDSNQERMMKANFGFAYSFITKIASQRKIKLLDIGAAYGYFIKYLSKNVAAEAVEVSSIGAERIREQGIKVYEGDFLKVKLNSKYDIITSFDVIEHQIFLTKFLNRVKALLTENGYFIFTTPDYGSFPNKIFGRRAPTIQPLYHNYYFDKDWIKENFHKSGFEIVKINTTYTTSVTLGHILLMVSFAFPILNKMKLFKYIGDHKISNYLITSIRLGGLLVIAKKTT